MTWEIARSNVPEDPVFQLVFPQPEMLSQEDLQTMSSAVRQPNISKVALREKAEAIRSTLNPHPAGQKEENVPILDEKAVPGMQHKYRDTILFFPTEVRGARAPTRLGTLLTRARANFVTRSAHTVSDGRSLQAWDPINSSSLKRSGD